MLTPVKMVCTHFTVFVCQNISRICQSHADEQKNCSWLQSFTRTTRHHFSGQWNPHYLWRSGSGVQSRAKQQHFETGWLGCPPFYAMLVIIDEQRSFPLKPENKFTVYTSISNPFILAKK